VPGLENHGYVGFVREMRIIFELNGVMVSFQNLKEHCSFFFAFSSITRESWGYVRANLHMSILSTAATYTSATFTSATFTTGLIESVIRGLVVYESSHTSQLD
jgi:K+-transporting ATPase A subunit